MQAAYMKDIDHIELREIDFGSLSENEIRLKVDVCGICGTDITAAVDGGDEYKPFGHEVAGTVVEIGAHVENVAVGQKVILESSSACGKCSNCRNMRQELCSNTVSFWYRNSLGFAEEMVSPAQCAVPYEGISPEEACLSEPLGVAIDMFSKTSINIGDHVLVSGLGPIGLMAVRLAKMAGAEKIYACDLSKARKRLEIAKEFGADTVIEVDKTPLAEYGFERPPNRFMVTSPPKTIPVMLEIAAPMSIVCFIGLKFGDGANISFDANEFHFKRLQLRSSFASPAMKTPWALELLRNGSIDGNALISHAFDLKQITEAMNVAVKDTGDTLKVIVGM